MSEPADRRRPEDPTNDPFGLLISVNRELSNETDAWYWVDDWRDESIDFASLPQKIRDGFITLVNDGTVGAFAEGMDSSGQPVKLYLINAPAIAALYPSAGGAGDTIVKFDTTLDDQTILVRGIRDGVDIYAQVPALVWSEAPKSPSFWIQAIVERMDALIIDTDLARELIADDTLPGASLNCYLLSLASFTNPKF